MIASKLNGLNLYLDKELCTESNVLSENFNKTNASYYNYTKKKN